MRAAYAASRDGRGGADRDGLGGTAGTPRGEAMLAGAGKRRCGSTGSGSVRERERKRERKGGHICTIGLGANNHGAKLSSKIYGAKLGVMVPAKSPPRLRRA